MRSLRIRSLAVAATGVMSLAVLALSSAAPAATGRADHAGASAHKCLVMTGSGDPAFTKNFNPYAGGGLPSNAFVQGAMYEPLIVTSAGGIPKETSHTGPGENGFNENCATKNGG